MERYFEVILRTSPYFGKIGILKGDVDYLGSPLGGWHTLSMPDGATALFAGGELVERFID
jgi:hypothetical protein